MFEAWRGRVRLGCVYKRPARRNFATSLFCVRSCCTFRAALLSFADSLCLFAGLTMASLSPLATSATIPLPWAVAMSLESLDNVKDLALTHNGHRLDSRPRRRRM